jgi:alpha-tubulin suppressor-like RCC1 family protein
MIPRASLATGGQSGHPLVSRQQDPALSSFRKGLLCRGNATDPCRRYVDGRRFECADLSGMLALVSLVLGASACLDLDALDGGEACLTAIEAGWSHTCARGTDGDVWCWGNNSVGQVGLSRDSYRYVQPEPSRVEGLDDVIDLALGDSHSCVVHRNATASCWGYNSAGQLGRERWVGMPARIEGLQGVQELAAGLSHTCARLEGGTVRCWGTNERGQLGSGSNAGGPTPLLVENLADVSAIAVGFTHSCALTRDGTPWCWGGNTYGQLGDGTRVDRSEPVAVKLDDVTRIAVALHHSCAIRDDGSVWCWGLNGQGQLGDGSKEDRALPVRAVGLKDATHISLGGSELNGPVAHSCALVEGGRVACWGANQSGQIAGPIGPGRAEARPVDGIEGASAIAAGAAHTCVVSDGAFINCWGANDKGQLGDGSLATPTSPVTRSNLCR